MLFEFVFEGRESERDGALACQRMKSTNGSSNGVVLMCPNAIVVHRRYEKQVLLFVKLLPTPRLHHSIEPTVPILDPFREKRKCWCHFNVLANSLDELRAKWGS